MLANELFIPTVSKTYLLGEGRDTCFVLHLDNISAVFKNLKDRKN